MTRRHAAALALVGWYLMLPPSKNDAVPLNQWIVARSYPSQPACLSAQTVYRDLATAKLKRYDRMTYEQRVSLEHNQQALDQEMNDRDNFDAAFQSACIESDDLRLRQK